MPCEPTAKPGRTANVSQVSRQVLPERFTVVFCESLVDTDAGQYGIGRRNAVAPVATPEVGVASGVTVRTTE